jgi:hypothetical protein
MKKSHEGSSFGLIFCGIDRVFQHAAWGFGQLKGSG